MSLDMFKLEPSPMNIIYESTCDELIMELSESLMEYIPTNSSYTQENGLGVAVYDINYNTIIDGIKKKYHNPEIRTSISYAEEESYFNFVEDIEIVKIGDKDVSVNSALEIVADLRKELKERFYGVLLMDDKKGTKKTYFNPLHPVMISELAHSECFIDKDAPEWTVAVYAVKEDSPTHKKIKNEVERFATDDYAEEIAGIVASIDRKSDYFIENSNLHADLEGDSFILTYDEKRILKETGEIIEGDNVSNYIIPCQIINVSGIGYPYYGSVYSRKGLAWNLSPMYSANISHPSGQSTRDGMEGGSRICTKSGNSSTKKGVSALNHCNTTSPLNRNCMNHGSYVYALTAIDAALELLMGESYIDAEPEKPEKMMTFKEFKELDKHLTKKHYLSYVKDYIEKYNKNVDEQKKVPEKTNIMDKTDPINLNSIGEPEQWDPTKVYRHGERVMHNGVEYEHISYARTPGIEMPMRSLRWRPVN